MHEGDHNILGDDHERDHTHDHRYPHKHASGDQHHDHGPARVDPKPVGSRLIAGVIVAAAVALFLVWRFL